MGKELYQRDHDRHQKHLHWNWPCLDGKLAEDHQSFHRLSCELFGALHLGVDLGRSNHICDICEHCESHVLQIKIQQNCD